jgi:hypothetical protein
MSLRFSMPKPHIYIRAALILAVIASMAAFAVHSNTASAHLRIAEDDGEDDGNAWSGRGWLSDWQFSNSYFTSFSGPHSGDWHLRVKEPGYAIRNLDVTGSGNLHLQLWAKVRDFHSSTHGYVEVSDDGSNYVPVKTWNNGEDDNVYRSYDFDLTGIGLDLDGELWVRFRVTGDDNDGDLFIDDIEAVNIGVEADEPPADDPASQITIDGEFDDWAGKASLADTIGDQDGGSSNDIAALYWANNVDSEVNYHMIMRRTTDQQPFNGSNGQAYESEYILYVDANNDGDFHDGGDRRVRISYDPDWSSGEVRVKVYSATSTNVISDTYWHDWGESRSEGGLRLEFAVSWDDLGIQFGQVIRMYLVEYEGWISDPDVDDRLPNSGNVQWSPASILGPWLLAAAMVLGIVVIWYFRGRRVWI